jgi:outer membrane protein assembly factor BamB
MRRFWSLIAIIAIIPFGAWMERGDAGRSGNFPVQITPKFYPEPKYTSKLSPIEGLDLVSVDFTPAVDEGTLVIPSAEGRIYALSTGDLTQKWTYDLKSIGIYASFTASPAISQGKIYIPYYWINPDPKSSSRPFAGICCIDLASGNLDWRTTNHKDRIESTPLIDGDRLVYGCSDRKVHAINIKAKGDSDADWKPIELTGEVKAGITKLNDGRYIVGCQGQPNEAYEVTKNLYCLNKNDGSIAWGPLQTKGSIDYTPAVWDNLVFVTTYGYIKEIDSDRSGILYCFDKDLNGNKTEALWEFPFKGRMTGSPATNGKYVVAADVGRQLCVFRTDGTSQAQYITGNIVMNSPIIADRYVYVGTRDGYIEIYDLETNFVVGEDQRTGEIQKLNVGANEAYLKGSPVFWNDSMYAVNSIGHVFRFDMKPNISVKFDAVELTIKKGESFTFKAVVKNERTIRLPQSVKVTLRLDSSVDWLKPSTDTTAMIQEASQQDIIEFSGIAQKATSKPLEAMVIVEAENLEIHPIFLRLFVTEKSLKVEPDRDYDIVWDDNLEGYFTLTNMGNIQMSLEVITDPGIYLLTSKSLLMNPDEKEVTKFRIEPKVCGYDKPVQLKFSFRSDGQDMSTFTINCTIKRTFRIIKLTIGKETAIVDDLEIKVQPAPFISKGTTMVPLRFVSEGLGTKSPEWYADIRTVIIDLGNNKYLRLIIGSTKAYLDQPDGSIKEIQMSTYPQIVKGRTFVPLRLISEQFGCQVEWNSKTREITITKRMKPF